MNIGQLSAKVAHNQFDIMHRRKQSATDWEVPGPPLAMPVVKLNVCAVFLCTFLWGT